MITTETFRGYKIVIGMTDYNPEMGRISRFCEIRHVETGQRIAREEFSAEIPVEVALEAARQRIIDEELRLEV